MVKKLSVACVCMFMLALTAGPAVAQISYCKDFLEPGKAYEATVYQDAPDAHGVENSEAYDITTAILKRDDVVQAKMAAGGGHAMIIRPVN